ncbi:cupin domain-containing protein [Variovorax sp. YR266]|uniref:cupin domain-containing protein n=1 Tax=Variovorax sp. YR266 TaxID=1884386 RepID=UPI00115FB0DA|nr:cupin domain-containing protein [Variovorax sp. YR266]
MNNYEVLNWKGLGQEISEDLIRVDFPPPEYRVSSKKYRSSEVLPPGAVRAGLLFVLRGKCKCGFGVDDGVSIILDAGQYVSFPEGRYQIEPLDGQDAEVAFVWNVLKIFNEIFPGQSRKIP